MLFRWKPMVIFMPPPAPSSSPGYALGELDSALGSVAYHDLHSRCSAEAPFGGFLRKGCGASGEVATNRDQSTRERASIAARLAVRAYAWEPSGANASRVLRTWNIIRQIVGRTISPIQRHRGKKT